MGSRIAVNHWGRATAPGLLHKTHTLFPWSFHAPLSRPDHIRSQCLRFAARTRHLESRQLPRDLVMLSARSERRVLGRLGLLVAQHRVPRG